MKNKINYNRWFQAGAKKKFEALEIQTNQCTTLTISSEDGLHNINSHVLSDLMTVTIKGLSQNKKVKCYLENINHLNDDMIDNILENLKQKAEIVNFKEKDFIYEGSKTYPKIPIKNFDFTSIPIQKKYNLLLDFEKEFFAKSHYLKNIDQIYYSETIYSETLANSKGLYLEEQGSFVKMGAICIFGKENSSIKEIYKNFTERTFTDIDIVKYANKIISLGESKIGAHSLKSNSYPTVFSNEIFASFLKCFSDIFSGENAYRSLTKLKGKEGQLIAAPNVTLIDDPLCLDSLFQSKFDDEGVACFPKKIIINGVFQQFIHNLKTAHIFNTHSTGNCFNGTVSMCNCYLQKGEKSLSEIISPIKEGVYIDYLIGLHAGVDTISGDFSLQAEGFKIKQGKITNPIKMIVISGNFFEMLKNIKDIASDFVFQASKLFGSASVYVGDLMIAGEK
ncbi:metallopeptidase TldD-related protein [Candidatus Phytoplasma phoenicium]|uniref:Putative modulator of DNA gyrase PmbA n=1 Tax=Candidatus Phytoplasma phoenicium TaxID=198422 RepID=A0A0L0MK01_9MOLU|nr:metallopeptidase TldD-related protein [Candidatus Phytoplasma phoenicium]KND62703.1 putative modulator of DNA gyrase PmbA [Candidatus Phytoplasma phoenicium]